MMSLSGMKACWNMPMSFVKNNLFGPSDGAHVSFDIDFPHVIGHDENLDQTKEFSLEEIKDNMLTRGS